MSDVSVDLDDGREALVLCLVVWGTTALAGLRFYLGPKYRGCSRKSGENNGGLRQQKTYRRARQTGEENAPIAIQLKDRITTELGKFHKAEKRLPYSPDFAPGINSFEERLFRVMDLYCALGFTLYEAYISICRTVGDVHDDEARAHISVMKPAVDRQETLSAQINDLLNEFLPADSEPPAADSEPSPMLNELLGKTLTLAEKHKELWGDLLEQNPQLKLTLPQDGRLNFGWDRRTARRYAIAKAVSNHMSFLDMRQAGLLLPLREKSHGKMRWLAALLPPQVRRRPIFYFALTALYIAVLAPFVRGIGKSSWGGLFGTFFPIPPQYCIDCFDDGGGVEIQRIIVPLLFGVMHTAMLSLCLMPLPLCKGLLRDFTNAGDTCRGLFPIEDSVWLHKVFGVLMIGALFLGAALWLIAMGTTCAGYSTDNQMAIDLACTAFAPVVFDAKAGPVLQANNVSTHVIMPDLLFDSISGASFFDPRDAVLFLRIVAWACFFGVSPWILIRNKTTFSRFVPRFIARNWFEIVTYAHVFVAWAALALALYARFEVFFFTLLSWGLLIVDKIRERLFHTFFMPIHFGRHNTNENHTEIHQDEANDDRSSAVEIMAKCPKNFKYSAGQYVFLTIPALGPTPHAFSLGSCPADDSLHFHIGVKAGRVYGPKNKNWVGEPKIDQRDPTWTFALSREIQRRMAAEESTPIRAIMRGPYGSPFQRCYTSARYATILVGQGTGLTSALSVLKQVIARRLSKEPTSERVWFVWSCRSISDLQWCWRTLLQTIFKACAEKAINLPEDWSPATSSTLDWLGISIFVSQAKKEKFLAFLGYGPDVEDEASRHETNTARAEHDQLNEMEMGQLPAAPDYTRPPEYSPPTSPLPTTSGQSVPRPQTNHRRCRRSSEIVHGVASGRTRSTDSVRSSRAGSPTVDSGSNGDVFWTMPEGHETRASPAAINMPERIVSLPVVDRVFGQRYSQRGRRRRISSSGPPTVEDQATYVSSQDRAQLDSDTRALYDRVRTAATQTALREAAEELAARLNEREDIRHQAEISAWLKEQVIPARMGDKGADIRDLLQNLKHMGGEGSAIAMCVCAGYRYAQNIHSICDDMGCEFEYLAHAE